MRNDLTDNLSEIPGLGMGSLSSKDLGERILSGDIKYVQIENKAILGATNCYVFSTKRLNGAF